MAAANASVNAANIYDPRIQGALRAVKRRFETNGLPEICPRCNSFCGDGSDCQRCGAWLGR
jgi:hypothetical protein